MATEARLQLVVLWEEEIRKAAKLLKQCVDKQGTDDFSDAAIDAINASIVALSGAENEENHICLVSGERDIVSRKSTKAPPRGA